MMQPESLDANAPDPPTVVARTSTSVMSAVVDESPVAYTSTLIPGRMAPPTAWTDWAGTLTASLPSGISKSLYELSKRSSEMTSPFKMDEVTVFPEMAEASRTAPSGRRSAIHDLVSIAERSTLSPAAISRVATQTSTCSPP